MTCRRETEPGRRVWRNISEPAWRSRACPPVALRLLPGDPTGGLHVGVWHHGSNGGLHKLKEGVR